jgi:hypothetical protein
MNTWSGTITLNGTAGSGTNPLENRSARARERSSSPA